MLYTWHACGALLMIFGSLRRVPDFNGKYSSGLAIYKIDAPFSRRFAFDCRVCHSSLLHALHPSLPLLVSLLPLPIAPGAHVDNPLNSPTDPPTVPGPSDIPVPRSHPYPNASCRPLSHAVFPVSPVSSVSPLLARVLARSFPHSRASPRSHLPSRPAPRAPCTHTHTHHHCHPLTAAAICGTLAACLYCCLPAVSPARPHPRGAP